MTTNPRIAVVLLNYNSEEDLFVSAEQLAQQKNIDLVEIIVDNASNSKTVTNIRSWIKEFDEDVVSGLTNDIDALDVEETKGVKTFIIYNDVNNGYSAGNNIGIKLAEKLNVDAVLIANPDMRFEDENYISKLVKVLYSDENHVIAASKIVGLDGKDQNPLRESSFLEEVFWPITILKNKYKNSTYVVPVNSTKSSVVCKVTGCCMMIKMSFLKRIDFLDENTFLYCEEPILSAQVKSENHTMVYEPSISAIHAHKKNEKQNSSKRMQLFIKSRKYYLKEYSTYNRAQLYILSISYFFMSQYYWAKYQIAKLKGIKE